MKKTLWSDSKTGKFVGLDHVIPLGDNGETVTAATDKKVKRKSLTLLYNEVRLFL